MSIARPFPFASLPAISRVEAEAAVRLRTATRHLVRVDAIAAAATELAGETVTLFVRRTRVLDAQRIPSDAVGVLFTPADNAGLAGAILVDVELALASTLVALSLRQRAPRVIDTSRPAVAIAGAFAALVHTVARRAHGKAPLRVIAAGPAPALAADLARAHGRILTASVTVRVGTDAFDARVSVPIEDLPAPGRETFDRERLAKIGETPLALALVIASTTASRVDLAALRRGDVLAVPDIGLGIEEGVLVGAVALVAARSERGLAGELTANGRLVVRTDTVQSHPWDRLRNPWGKNQPGDMGQSPVASSPSREMNQEPAMSSDPSATLEALEDAPVVVRVELGVVEMKAQEWAELSNGDVVTLGRKLGDPAILRVGGVEVARGELVQVDGEYGVKILDRGERR